MSDESDKTQRINVNADEFLDDLEKVGNETRLERAGRHYSEERQRYASLDAVSRLASAVAEIAKAQAATTQSMVALAERIDKMERSFERVSVWIEGDIDTSGNRIPGLIDQMASWRKWKNTISAGTITTAAGILGLLIVAIARLVLDIGATSMGVHSSIR